MNITMLEKKNGLSAQFSKNAHENNKISDLPKWQIFKS